MKYLQLQNHDYFQEKHHENYLYKETLNYQEEINVFFITIMMIVYYFVQYSSFYLFNAPLIQNYSIFISKDTNQKPTANAQYIKMLKTRKGSKWNNTYLCQEILDMRIRRGARQYLIKWEGYQEKDNTWEPISNLIYIIDDLINFERQNAVKHKQKEDEWKKMYQEKKVKDPLQPFQPIKLKKLIRIQPQPFSQTDSESLAKTAKNKPIAKNRTRGGKYLQQLDIQKTAKKEREKVTVRRRGRPQKKMQLSQSSSEQADTPEQKQVQKKKDFEENSSSSIQLSPQKSQFVDEHLKGIFIECFDAHNDRKQQRQPQREQQPINIQEKSFIQNINDNQQDNQELYRVLTINDKKNSEQEKDERSIIQEQIIQRNIEQSPKIDACQEPKKVTIEQNKNESIFKNNYSKFPLFDTNNNASLSSPLHKGVTKYLYRPQKKIAKQQKCDSQSQSFRDEALNPGFQQKPIIQLQQEQKSSTPLALINYKPSEVDQNQNQTEKRHQDVGSQQKKDIQKQLSIRQDKNDEDKHQNSKQQYSEPIYQRLRSRENHKSMESESSSSEEQKQAEIVALISQPQNQQEKPNKSTSKIPQAIGTRYQTLKRTNQRIQSRQFPLKSFQKKQKHIQHEIIDLSGSQSQHYSQGSLRIKAFNKPSQPFPKTKKIKKEMFNSSYKKKQAIPHEDEEYQDRKQSSSAEFQPGLSAIFQMLLTANQLECHKNAHMEKIISHFIIEKVIIFSVKASVSKPEPELRFATYQTIRNFFPSELLTYLQLKNCITL